MNSTQAIRIAVALVVALAVGVVIAVKRSQDHAEALPTSDESGAVAALPESAPTEAQRDAQLPSATLPKLVDLGSTTCIPCKKMAPILEALGEEFAGRFDVEFIDVQNDHAAARQYGVRLIPTQVFLDAAGAELARHQGFMSRQDILATWESLGHGFGKPPSNQRDLAPQGRPKVVAYYFHGETRCLSCLTIEQLAQEAIARCWAEDLKSRRLEWRAVNYDQPDNEHYLDLFDLAHSSLVLTRYVGDTLERWQVLDRVWELTESENLLQDYICDEIERYLDNRL